MKETKKTDETFPLIVVMKDNSSLTYKHTSVDSWICVPNPESSTDAASSNSSTSLSILGGKKSPWDISQTNKQNQLIEFTFLFYWPHHLLNNLNIYYCTPNNNKITKVSLSMILSSWSICGFNFAQWKRCIGWSY